MWGVAYLMQTEWSLIGFPDSHFTEYDRARGPLYRVWYTVNYGWGLLTLAFTVSNRGKFWRRLCWSVSLFTLCQLAFRGYDWHLFQVLEHGQGG